MVGEEGLNPESFLVPVACLLWRLNIDDKNIGDKIDGLFVSLLPPEDSTNRTIGFEKDILQTHGLAVPGGEKPPQRRTFSLP
jgi:hypothetical protein